MQVISQTCLCDPKDEVDGSQVAEHLGVGPDSPEGDETTWHAVDPNVRFTATEKPDLEDDDEEDEDEEDDDDDDEDDDVDAEDEDDEFKEESAEDEDDDEPDPIG